jgi:hypothetical protein
MRSAELTSRQRAGVIGVGVVELALLAAALVDLHRRPASRIRGSKRAWRLAAFVNFVGPLAYFALGRRRS